MVGTRSGSRASSRAPSPPPGDNPGTGTARDSGVSAALKRISVVLASLEERMTDTEQALQSLSGKGKGRKRTLADINEGEEDDEDGRSRDDYPPVRGIHGKCDPIDVRYNFLDTKTRDAAIAGTLPPESLPLLIPSTADIRRAPVDSDGAPQGFIASPGGKTLHAIRTKSAQTDAVSKFIAAIPDPTLFMIAWGNLIDLMGHGLGDPSAAKELAIAMWWYAHWLVNKSVNHTWSSLMTYHIKVCRERLNGSFHVDQWYKMVDNDKISDVMHKSLAALSVAGPSRTSKARPAETREKTRDVSKEFCFDWNLGICPDGPCQDGRIHACSKCKKATATHCSTDAACPLRRRAKRK